MTCCKNAFRFFLLGSALFSCISAAAAGCLQPAVIDAKALVMPSAFVDARDQLTHPDASRIASQVASVINKKQTDAAIDAQVGYIRCLADAGRHRQIIAAITDDGVIHLQRITSTTSQKNVAAN